METDPFSRASAKLLALLNEGDPQKLSKFIFKRTEDQNLFSRQDAVELREELVHLLGPDLGIKEVETYIRSLTERSPAENTSPEYQETPSFNPFPQDRFFQDDPQPIVSPSTKRYPQTIAQCPVERYARLLPQPIAAPSIERHSYRPYPSPQEKELQGLRPYAPIDENYPQNPTSSYAFHRERNPQRLQPRSPDSETFQGVQHSRNHILSEEISTQISPNLHQKAHLIFKAYDIFSEGRLGAQDSFIALLELHVQNVRSTTRPDFENFTRLFRRIAGRNESVSFREFLSLLPLIL